MSDATYMRRCLEIALKGKGSVEPNPMVGSVIVHDGKIIGEGYHKKYGDSHAEVNAIASVKDKSLLAKSTIYVNLEPCSHFGKTPPCADLIIEKRIPRVVMGCLDPNPLVAGKGAQKLRDAGVEVVSPVIEKECRFLNRRFMSFHELKRPYVILKWAQGKNGVMGDSKKRLLVSSKAAQKLVHQWRTEEPGIMVGTNTVALDDPSLTARLVKGRNPLRIVVDRQLKLKSDLHIFDESAPTVIFTAKSVMDRKKKANIEYETINFNRNVLQQIMVALHKRNILSVMVEGGSQLLQSFIKENLWDEARVFVSAKELDGDVKAPELPIKLANKRCMGKDTMMTFFNARLSDVPRKAYH